MTSWWWWDRAINAVTAAALIYLGYHMARRNRMLQQQGRQNRAIADMLLLLHGVGDPDPPAARGRHALKLAGDAGLRERKVTPLR